MKRRFLSHNCCFLILITCFSCSETTQKEVIKVEKEGPITSQINSIFDTVFTDGTCFKCHFSDSILQFEVRNENQFYKGNLDTFRIDLMKNFPNMDFEPGIWRNGNYRNGGNLFYNGKIILFGYEYQPHGVCLYYVKLDHEFSFGCKYHDMKWFYPTINADEMELISFSDDWARDSDFSDAILPFIMSKWKLTDYPDFSRRDTILFHNYDIVYDYPDGTNNVDSCLWVKMLSLNEKIRKFVLSK